MKQHLKQVCSEYCMDASDVYNILLSRNDDNFPLSFDTVRIMVLKDIPLDILKEIFNQDELISIFSDSNLNKIRNQDTKKFINSLIK